MRLQPLRAPHQGAKRVNEGEELVATEERGTQAGRQIGPIPPRTNQAVQPALGQMRIGILLRHQNRARTTSLLIIARRASQRNPQSR